MPDRRSRSSTLSRSTVSCLTSRRRRANSSRPKGSARRRPANTPSQEETTAETRRARVADVAVLRACPHAPGAREALVRRASSVPVCGGRRPRGPATPAPVAEAEHDAAAARDEVQSAVHQNRPVAGNRLPATSPYVDYDDISRSRWSEPLPRADVGKLHSESAADIPRGEPRPDPIRHLERRCNVPGSCPDAAHLGRDTRRAVGERGRIHLTIARAPDPGANYLTH